MNEITRMLDALQLADGLMADDPAKFKRGYSRENAELAVIDYMKLTDDEREQFLRLMGQKYA